MADGLVHEAIEIRVWTIDRISRLCLGVWLENLGMPTLPCLAGKMLSATGRRREQVG
jgi:hypothetical protein